MLFYPGRYKLLLKQVDATERSIAKLVEQQRQIREALTQQQTQHEHDIAILRDTFSGQIAQLCEVVDLQHSKLEPLAVRMNDSQQQLDQLRDVLTATLAHQEKQTQHHLHEFETCLTEHRQAVEQMTQLLTTQTERQADTLRDQRKEIEAVLAEHLHDVGNALQGVKQDGSADLTAFNQRFERIEVQLQQLATGEGQTKKASAQRAAPFPSQKATRQRR